MFIYPFCWLLLAQLGAAALRPKAGRGVVEKDLCSSLGQAREVLQMRSLRKSEIVETDGALTLVS